MSAGAGRLVVPVLCGLPGGGLASVGPFEYWMRTPHRRTGTGKGALPLEYLQLEENNAFRRNHNNQCKSGLLWTGTCVAASKPILI